MNVLLIPGVEMDVTLKCSLDLIDVRLTCLTNITYLLKHMN